jgi:nicotinamidase/pyrazinamidase
MSDKALVIVDVQNCFCPGGSLPVKDGDQVVPIINDYIERFTALGLSVYATRDWHPEVTKHFKEYGGQWPPHCIQNTPEAQFHPDLKLPEGTEVISAGMQPNEEGYSGFEGTNDEGIGLEESLRTRGVMHLYICGLATDYCVKHTAIDAVREGFRTTLLIDAVRGVDVEPGDSERAVEEMKQAGVEMMTHQQVDEQLSGRQTVRG